MSPSGPGLVAAGDDGTAEAAAELLRAGGNAFDAVVAAGFASAITESCFTSLAGGGYLLARTASGDSALLDFFVDTPGRGLSAPADPVFEEVAVAFDAATQLFHCGPGSVAVPGVLAGYLEIHRRFGRVELGQVLAPAIRLAEQGCAVSPTQAHVFGLLEPILRRTPASRALYLRRDRLLRAGERFVNPELGAYLRVLATDPDDTVYVGDRAAAFAAENQAGGGLITVEDLAAYRVIDRRPLTIPFAGRTVLTNPPPTFGGALLGLALTRLERAGLAQADSPDRAAQLVEVMAGIDADRADGHPDVLAALADSGDPPPLASRGTTHITVVDDEGNVAAMTTSNGECSGDLIGGLGIACNNMLGEDDLHPDGFHAAPAGTRVASMMAPTVVLDADGRVELALGSGGSKRIRSALLQVLVHVLVDNRELEEAVTAPRLHWDTDHVEAEPGLDTTALDALADRWRVNRWPAPNLYFGGVHAVAPGLAAAGDPRRGGASRRVPITGDQTFTGR